MYARRSILTLFVGFSIVTSYAAQDSEKTDVKTEKPRETAKRLRVIMSTDFPPIGVVKGGNAPADRKSDPDDMQSMVRFLLYANEFDIEGLIASAGTFANKARKRHILEVIDRYEQVYENLKTHDPLYPAPDDLRSVTFQGRSGTWGKKGTVNIGAGKDSEASDAVIAIADRPDPRPIYIGVWGDCSVVAQAVWKVQNTRSPAELDTFLGKLRIHQIATQDGTIGWLRDNYPNLFIIHSRKTYQGMFGGRDPISNLAWVNENIRRSHGPLCDVYPHEGMGCTGVCEGDSPSFLWLVSANRGLNDPDDPTQPSWGGQFKRVDGTNHYVDGPGGSSISRWRKDYQKEFAERADWCVSPLPVSAGALKSEREEPKSKSGARGPTGYRPRIINTTDLGADPDDEPSSYDASVKMEGADSAAARVSVPSNAGGKSLHIILEVHDDGDPALYAYRRVIISVQASPSTAVSREAADTAANVVVEVESLELSQVEVRELEAASGKVVAFDVAGAEARGEVELDRGVYEVFLYMFAPDGSHDAVNVSVGGTRKRLYPSKHATLTESSSFSLNVAEAEKYPVAITFGEPGVLLDRLVIRSLPGRTPTEPVDERARLAEALAASTKVEPGPSDGRLRIIVTSDGEIDDECSMVRFLLYANEWDVEAIISSSSQYHSHGHNWAGDDWMDPYLKAYAEVYPNLVKHDAGYPRPEYLRARTLLGNVKAEGEMDEVTAGAQYIVKVLLDRSDHQPVWLQAWGGPNTIARALKTIEEDHPDQMVYVAKKMRFFFIWEQDSTYQDYIRPRWGKYNIPTIVSDQFVAFAYHWERILPEETHDVFRGDWMTRHILKAHGPLCSLYKAHEDGRFRSEGDSPAFLHAIPVGLRSTESPDWGGWGGRYVRVRENTWLDPVLEPGYRYPEGRWYTSNAWGRSRMRESISNDQELAAYLKPMWRWFDAIQNDFAARADWCIKPYDQANHPPMVRLSHAMDLKVRPGQKVSLSAMGTTDPDGDALTYRWWQYQEADTYEGAVEIVSAESQVASFTVPGEGEKGETIHIVCEVTDSGIPPLTRYQRVVVEID